MLSLSAFDPAAITAEVDAMSICHDFGSSIPFCFLQSSNVTTLRSTGSQQVVDDADSSPAAIPVAFSEEMPPAFRSVPGIFYPGYYPHCSDVLDAALPTRLDFSIVDTFTYSRVSSAATL